MLVTARDRLRSILRTSLLVSVPLLLLACGGEAGSPAQGADGAAGARGQAASDTAGPTGAGGPAPDAEGRYGIKVDVDRKVYNPGDTIHMALTAFNRTGQPLVLNFPTAQRFDFLLRRGEDGLGAEPVWRWSRDRFFTQSEGVERLTPGRPAIEYTASRRAPGEPGIYLVVGKITAASWPLSATVPITVAP